LPSAQRNQLLNSARLSLLQLAGPVLSRQIPPRSAEVRRVLLVRPDHVGDVLLTASAIALLCESLPWAQLTYVVGPWSVEVAAHGPSVDRLRTLAYPGFTRRKNANPLAPYALLVREAARLRRERYDLAVVFRPDHWWGALLALAAGIPVRVGGDTPETAPLLTHRSPTVAGRHTAEDAIAIAHSALEALGSKAAQPTDVTVFRVSDAARTVAAEFWLRNALDGRQVVALQPSAGAPLKSWPTDHWAQLADQLGEQGLAVLLVGGPGDGPLLQDVRARMTRSPAAVTCDQSLDVAAALYQRCSVLVGVDGGAAHLAAAVGTPTVRLYGPAPADVFGPWPPRKDQRVLVTSALACVPCGQLAAPPCGATALPACMLALGVDEVLKAIKAELSHG
jgi:ADP-heptose:LPS heptosyltransferase